MVPSTARFVTNIAYHDVAIWDITLMLANHPGRKYNHREKPISQIFVHKSGADGPPGYRGYLACASFCVNHRKWPGVPYHYWISREPDLDRNNNMVIYQGQPESIVSWHTGGANTWSIGIGVQGNYDGDWDLIDGIPQIQREPTDKQFLMIGALVEYLAIRHGLKIKNAFHPFPLSGHWEAPRPKAVCPGDALRQWVIEKRGSTPPPKLPIAQQPQLTQALISNKMAQKWPIQDLQRALALLGHSPGKIDGIFGYKTRRAVERFQRDNRLTVDGWVGKRTAVALQKGVIQKGIPTVHALRNLSL